MCLKHKSVEEYISIYCSELGLSDKIKGRCLEVYSSAVDGGLFASTGPACVAIAVIYMAVDVSGSELSCQRVLEFGVDEKNIPRYSIERRLSSLRSLG
ncbi:hypothetical protein [Methanonatronarchaeum sp. AMET-Sl]|uniref:hypothetical protein n=1 Tax=Methanonatronarchaeum sp. AMET-Sl TaxID=3037654 RepID=UPI00244DF032|nr:hypothetical protein [Methanonatronarchaeum sp. AMET-Sl]WGI17179.1 hypothetical protein QEN48_06665 [Methanonatronarchaeum sp. AMET-Sl]